MSNFIKNSLEELEHVVWPTDGETKRYMLYTVGTIIIVSLLLAILGYAIQSGLKGVRSQFDHTRVLHTEEKSDIATKADLENILSDLKKSDSLQSGSVNSLGSGEIRGSGITSSGN